MIPRFMLAQFERGNQSDGRHHGFQGRKKTLKPLDANQLQHPTSIRCLDALCAELRLFEIPESVYSYYWYMSSCGLPKNGSLVISDEADRIAYQGPPISGKIGPI